MQLRTWLYLKDVSKYGGLTSGMTTGYFNVERGPVSRILFDDPPKLVAEAEAIPEPADDDV
jgi:hypothetical protein